MARSLLPEQHEQMRKFLGLPRSVAIGHTDPRQVVSWLRTQNAQGGPIVIPEGTWQIDDDITFTVPVMTLGTLNVASGKTITIGSVGSLDMTSGGLISGTGSLTFAAGSSAELPESKQVFGAGLTVTFAAGQEFNSTNFATLAAAVVAIPTNGTLHIRGTNSITSALTPASNTRWVLERDAVIVDGVGYSGTHIVSIVNVSNFTLEGTGKIRSTASDSNSALVGINIAPTVAQSGLTFRDFTIEDFSINTSGVSYTGFGWRIWDPAANITDVIVQNVTVRDSKWGIYFWSTGAGVISDVQVLGCQVYHHDLSLIATAGNQLAVGIGVDRVNAGGEGIQIANCKVSSYMFGVALASAKKVQISDLMVRNLTGITATDGNRSEGIHIEATSPYGDCEDIVIDGFHIDDAYGSAVQFTYGGSGTDIVRNVQLMNGFIRTGAINRGGISLSLPSTNIAQDIDISNIAVYGDDSATDGRTGVYANYVRGLRLNNIYVKDAYRAGIALDWARQVAMKNCETEDCNWQDSALYANLMISWMAAGVTVQGHISKIIDRSGGTNKLCYYHPEKSYTGLTNATPIQVTASAHEFLTGDRVMLADESGNMGANGVWIVTYVDANNFTLDDSVGNGASANSGKLTGANIAFLGCSYYGGSVSGTSPFVRPYEMTDLYNDTIDVRREEQYSTSSVNRYPKYRIDSSGVLTALEFKMASISSATGNAGMRVTWSATPEASLTANAGTLAFAPASSVSPLWIKRSGSGNTDWLPLINESVITKDATAGSVTYTVATNDQVILCITGIGGGGNDVVLNWPDANSMLGRSLTVFFKTDGGGTVTIQRAGSDVFNGWDANTSAYVISKTYAQMSDAGDFIVLKSVDSNQWLIVENNGATVA